MFPPTNSAGHPNILRRWASGCRDATASKRSTSDSGDFPKPGCTSGPSVDDGDASSGAGEEGAPLPDERLGALLRELERRRVDVDAGLAERGQDVARLGGGPR